LIADYRQLLHDLGIGLEQAELLEKALTHRSKSSKNYERLEFLGDSVLGFLIASELYQRYSDLSEGELTRLRATLVRKETLADIARDVELGNYLRLGGGELKSGGFDRDSILADSLEAVIGAIYVDQGIDTARTMVLRLFSSRLENPEPEALEKDPKTLLQEYLQKNAIDTPEYSVDSVEGAAHDQYFVVTCKISGVKEAYTGEGRSRKKAEQDAARKALTAIVGQ
jgi:ribonuclease-3